ncbi:MULTISPECIES: hypothetical protein [Enterobacter cloacae complex]|nr:MULTISPECIES: hypothetical protein [Enterobacter cloacae complex]AVU50621.1 hypothetical protein AXJ76_11270 [Enterobacter cloacae]EHE7812618.1 hypothetical protein [Enterobacter hormaechei]EHF3578245.1 hypothetical protein [Enterobacter hormaechei]KJL69709.1 hypothetical protein SS38_17725 [Enterobacter hormaechei subsp. xiangfangensis]KJM71370.1 hypothetical protein SS16_21510 [Enterobacter hormaechei subsp. xiangfangensis]
MNAKQLNAMTLMNNIKRYIEMLTNTKATMKAVVKDWNTYIEQSGADFLTFDFPVEGWTRKAQLIAEFERVAVQLNNIMEGREALENAPVKHETMVQDIKKGDVVMCPARPSQCQTVTNVDDFSCYFIITFSGDMGQQYFDRGETLIVCEPVNGSQITNVSTTEVNDMNEANNQLVPAIDSESSIMELRANCLYMLFRSYNPTPEAINQVTRAAITTAMIHYQNEPCQHTLNSILLIGDIIADGRYSQTLNGNDDAAREFYRSFALIVSATEPEALRSILSNHMAETLNV